jgi:aminoglycoside 3-N-acetyltransferase
MYKEQDLVKHLKELGINENGTLLVHSSMKSIGNVEGGGDTVLDALSEYMKNGFLVLPTHTYHIRIICL